MAIDELTSVCPPPNSPVANMGDWSAVEATLGTALPDDYKEIIAIYGAGTFGDFVVIYSPFRATAEHGLVVCSAEWLDGERWLRDNSPGPHPEALHPEPGGLLPWGVTDNGGACCWVTTIGGPPDGWSIAVNEGRGPDWFHAPGPLSQFLADVLTGRVAVSVFPDDFPDPDEPPSFRPVTAS